MENVRLPREGDNACLHLWLNDQKVAWSLISDQIKWFEYIDQQNGISGDGQPLALVFKWREGEH